VPAPEPEPTPIPPPPTLPREVRNLAIVTDSVVATATVQYNGTPPSLIVYWGDNTATELTPPPADQVVLRHQYAPPPDGAKFSRVVNPLPGPPGSGSSKAWYQERLMDDLNRLRTVAGQ